MNSNLLKSLRELYVIVNNFSVTGEGVSGSLEEGYIVQWSPNGTQPMDVPEGPERPESPEQ